MTDLASFVGVPVDFNHKCLIYPPKVKDVVGNPNFGKYLRILTMTQEELQDEFGRKLQEGQRIPTPYEFLLANCYSSEEFKRIASDAFFFFTKMKPSFLIDQKKIVFGDFQKYIIEGLAPDKWPMLNEDEFFDFQNSIRASIGGKVIDKPTPIDPNEDPRITRMKALARYRDRIKAKQGVKGGISFYSSLVAICCMGLGITPLNIGEMSYASIAPITKAYQEKEKYDIDVRSLLAGSKKAHPKYWIRNYTD